VSRMTVIPERLAQAVAERVVALVVDALDIDAILAKVDVDALLARIDVDALIERIDIEKLLKRIDMSSTVGAAASSVTDEALEAVRRTAVRGDELTAHWVYRLIGRP
jgi:hypothetical protein